MRSGRITDALRLPALSLPSAGAMVVVIIAGLIASAFAALFSAAGETSGLGELGPYLVRVLVFSLAQAAISTALSLALGMALALALARRVFPGKALILSLLGAATAMPAIVVVFAVIAVYGRGGWLASGLNVLGFSPDFRIFGWPGILIAHVLLNAPFVARVCLDALAQVPAEQWRLAQSLGFKPAEIARHLDGPVLRANLAPVASLVFLLCFTSFAIVLNLGGGGGRATLEVAIYEALRSDLDFARAAWLALVQVAICGVLSAALRRAVVRPPAGQTTRLAVARPDAAHRGLKIWDVGVLLVSGLLILPPLASLLGGAVHMPAVMGADLARALATSLVLATLSGVLACLMAFALATAARTGRAAAYDVLPTLVLAVPPFALAAGLYLTVRRIADPALAGVVLLPLINALGALPFAYRFIAPAVRTAGERYGRLADLLGLAGWSYLRVVDWPLLRRPLAAGLALSMALSFGDFGVIALFGGGELRTLPYLLFERLGAYRLDEAAAVGLIIVAVSFALAAVSLWLTHARD